MVHTLGMHNLIYNASLQTYTLRERGRLSRVDPLMATILSNTYQVGGSRHSVFGDPDIEKTTLSPFLF